MKAKSAQAGVVPQPGEWKWPIGQDAPDLDLLAQTSISPGVLADLDGRLGPVFVTDIQRTGCDLRLDNSTRIEAVLDKGTISADTSSQAVREFELELKEGSRAALYGLARDLHAAVPLLITVESKVERGRRLKTGAPSAACKASDLHLTSDLDVAEAFRRFVRTCLGHLVGNQAAARAGVPEGVHQMRIALRRLRTAMVLFDPHLKPKARQKLDVELQRLGRVLGDARDWDVFCLETLPAAMDALSNDSWAELAEAAKAKCRTAHRRLRGELDGPALTGLVLSMAAESEGEPGVSALLRRSARRPLLEQAPRMLDRVARQAAKRGGKLAHRSEPELHALRKSLKRLRYSVEFLGSLYDRESVKSYAHHCKELQEGLGAVNDAAVAENLLGRLSKANPAKIHGSAAALTRWGHQCRGRARHRSVEGWREFKQTLPFWADTASGGFR